MSHPLHDFSMPVGMISGHAPSYPSAPGGQEALKQDLDALGAQYEETQGRYGALEPSILTYGLPREHLMALGKKYGQESVIHSEAGQRQFIYTNGPNQGHYHPGFDESRHEHWEEGHPEPPADYWTKVPGHGYSRLHFDSDQLLPVDADPAVPRPGPLAVVPQAPVAPPGQQEGPGQVPSKVAAAPVQKHGVLEVLHQGLLELLAKTSKNVRAQRVNITPQQAIMRRIRYAQSIGLKPVAQDFESGKFPQAEGNVIPYDPQFSVEHETAHAMMVPPGKSVREYQDELTPTRKAPGSERAYHGPRAMNELVQDPTYQAHAIGTQQENVANALEYAIDRRAGVDQSQASQYRTASPPLSSTPFGIRSHLKPPLEGVDLFSRKKNSGNNDLPAQDKAGNNVASQPIRDEAKQYTQRFDAGAKFNNQGRVVPPQGVDARINERAARPRLPGQHLFRRPGLTKADVAQLPVQNPHVRDYTPRLWPQYQQAGYTLNVRHDPETSTLHADLGFKGKPAANLSAPLQGPRIGPTHGQMDDHPLYENMHLALKHRAHDLHYENLPVDPKGALLRLFSAGGGSNDSGAE